MGMLEWLSLSFSSVIAGPQFKWLLLQSSLTSYMVAQDSSKSKSFQVFVRLSLGNNTFYWLKQSHGQLSFKGRVNKLHLLMGIGGKSDKELVALFNLPPQQYSTWWLPPSARVLGSVQSGKDSLANTHGCMSEKYVSAVLSR